MARSNPYGQRHQRIRRQMLDPPVLCAHCRRRQATELDHDPPLSMHIHREGSACCRLVPSCGPCNRTSGFAVRDGVWRPGYSPVGDDLPPERDGLDVEHPAWDVPWLEGLRDVPVDATWPRLMTVPHPNAVGSLGEDFAAFAHERSGRQLRWWQRLVATRLLEVDRGGRLVWEAMVLSLARQLGKSWLLRELCLWRIHQGERFGEPQDVLHTGKDLAICKEVQRHARLWAKARRGTYRVREVNGQEEIELLRDGSRWMIRAKEAVYGYSVSCAAADEAWKVKASSIEEGLTPTMTEREQPQLLLVSTAHRMATSLMLGRRQVALEQLETGAGDLLIEWSAPAGTDVEEGWRLASPHWTPRRERMIGQRLELAKGGESEDPDEPDPLESFKAQWLNQWPRRRTEPVGATEPLLPDGLWAELAEEGLESAGPLWVAVEDDYGLGAAVVAAATLEDGRLEVDGWTCEDWDTALTDVDALASQRPINVLLVGASLIGRVPDHLGAPEPQGTPQTRTGLAVIRDLAQTGRLVHDRTPELDRAMEQAQVREAASGLHLVARGQTHLIRAAAWALAAAHKLERVPAIH